MTSQKQENRSGLDIDTELLRETLDSILRFVEKVRQAYEIRRQVNEIRFKSFKVMCQPIVDYEIKLSHEYPLYIFDPDLKEPKQLSTYKRVAFDNTTIKIIDTSGTVMHIIDLCNMSPLDLVVLAINLGPALKDLEEAIDEEIESYKKVLEVAKKAYLVLQMMKQSSS